MAVSLTKRELATVLAALRYWQRSFEDNDDGPIDGEHFDEATTQLTVTEIDELCERLNGD